MDNMEEKLNSILSNPQAMQQIMALAQSLGNGSSPQEPKEKQEPEIPGTQPKLDLNTLQRLSSLTAQTGISKDQQALLQALSPYLPRDRVTKLEKAMQAAKMAKLASAFLGNGGLQMLSGR